MWGRFTISRSVRAAPFPHPRRTCQIEPLIIVIFGLAVFVLGFSGYGAFVVIKGFWS